MMTTPQLQGVIDGITGNFFWEMFAKPIVEKVTAVAKDAWQQVNWKEAQKDYYQRIAKFYGTVRILGKSSPVPLEGIFTDVYILDKPTAYRRFEIQQLREDPSRLREWETERTNGLEVVKHYKNSRLFILGKPGAGKTTFLKYIALQAVQGQLDRIPIFVSLKEWSDSGLELMPFLVRQFEICKFPQAQPFIEEILKAGKAIVLFDGLDEVQQERDQRARLINVLRDFSKQYLASPCLITCRIAATDYSFDQFTYVEVADFTEAQMQTFVKKWFRDDPNKGEMFLAEFKKDDHQGLRDLGQIPLLLTLLCLAFEETLHFPARRVEIYEEALEALLKKWDTSRNIKRDEVYRKLSLGRKRQMLARIAADTFEKGDYFLRQTELAKPIAGYLQTLPPGDKGKEEIEGDVVLKAIEAQHGILVERAHQIYSFSHLTFQEYFTAKYIVENASKGTLEGLMNHLGNARWREVFLLTASLLDNADAFFGLFKRAIDDLVKGDEQLVKLLKWATKKAAMANVQFKYPVIRSVYCTLALIRVRGGAFGLNDFVAVINRALSFIRSPDNATNTNISVLLLDRASDLAYTLSRNGAIKHSIAFAAHLDHAFTDSSSCDHNLNIDLHLSFALYFAITFSLIDRHKFLNFRDKAISKLTNYFRQIISYLQWRLSVATFDVNRGLAKSLANLTIPNENDRQDAWQPFATTLRKIMQTHRNIGYEWNLTEAQLECLERYFAANLLLVECLKLAVVSDREGIERSLLTIGSGE